MKLKTRKMPFTFYYLFSQVTSLKSLFIFVIVFSYAQILYSFQLLFCVFQSWKHENKIKLKTALEKKLIHKTPSFILLSS